MITKLFLDHPRQVEETYAEHAVFAGRISLRLFGAAFAALMHALIPVMFEKTASRIIRDLAQDTKGRGS